MKSNNTVVAAAVFGTVLLATFSTRLGGQTADSPSQSNLHDLGAKKTALMNNSKDFTMMAESLQGKGMEFETALEAGRIAQKATMEIDATILFLGLYYNMQCEPDRATAKAVLKNRLDAYSQMLGDDANTTVEYLTLTKLPATAQAGLEMRDQLRAAKNKLDAIAASLE